MPSLDLPERDYDQLARAPLELLVCQTRFQALPLEPTQVFLVRDALRDTLPELQPVEQRTADITIGGGTAGLSPVTSQQGWQLASADASWSATLLPDSLALQTTRHTTWGTDFRPLWTRLVELVAEHLHPTIELRTGVRYVDRVTSSESLECPWPRQTPRSWPRNSPLTASA